MDLPEPGKHRRTSARLALGAALLAVGLALSLPAGAVDKPTTSPTAQDRLASARVHIRAKNWNAARAELLIAERDEPNNADIHNLLGYAYRKQERRDLPAAFKHYQRALQLDPTHKGAHEYIGEAYLMDGKLAQAERHLVELESLCGNRSCEEYQDLAGAIAKFKAAK